MSEDPSHKDEVRLNVQVHQTKYDLMKEVEQAWDGIPLAPDGGQVELNFGPEYAHRFELYAVNTVHVDHLSNPQPLEPSTWLMSRGMKELQDQTDCLIETAEVDGRDRPLKFYFAGVYDKQ